MRDWLYTQNVHAHSMPPGPGFRLTPGGLSHLLISKHTARNRTPSAPTALPPTWQALSHALSVASARVRMRCFSCCSTSPACLARTAASMASALLISSHWMCRRGRGGGAGRVNCCCCCCCAGGGGLGWGRAKPTGQPGAWTARAYVVSYMQRVQAGGVTVAPAGVAQPEHAAKTVRCKMHEVEIFSTCINSSIVCRCTELWHPKPVGKESVSMTMSCLGSNQLSEPTIIFGVSCRWPLLPACLPCRPPGPAAVPAAAQACRIPTPRHPLPGGRVSARGVPRMVPGALHPTLPAVLPTAACRAALPGSQSAALPAALC